MQNERYLTPNEQKSAMERDKRDYMRQCIDEEKNRSENYFLGFWGALSGALLGAVFYGFIRSNGFVSFWMGFVMAVIASKCYDATNVKRNMYKLLCVVISCVIAVPCGEIIGDIIAILGDERTAPFIGKVYDYYRENKLQYFIDCAVPLFLGYVFTAIGGFFVFKKINDNNNRLVEMEEALAEYEEMTDEVEL